MAGGTDSRRNPSAGGQLTPLQLAALGVLLERPMHPYEAYGVLAARRADLVVKLRPGTLYHAIGRLADSGHIEVVGTDREGNRPERTTYRLTELGRQAFGDSIAALIAVPVNEYPRFGLGLSELHNFPRADAVRWLRQRCAVLVAERDAMAAAIAKCDEHAVARIHVLQLEYTHHQVAAEVAWLDDLITRFIEGELPGRRAPIDPETQEAVTAITCEHASLLHPLPPRQPNPRSRR